TTQVEPSHEIEDPELQSLVDHVSELTKTLQAVSQKRGDVGADETPCAATTVRQTVSSHSTSCEEHPAQETPPQTSCDLPCDHPDPQSDRPISDAEDAPLLYSTTRSPLKEISPEELGSDDFFEPGWLWDGYLMRGGVTVMVSTGKVGKTTLLG